MQAFFMGVDLGTSSIRAILFDEKGRQAGFGSEECSIVTTVDGKAEMDPDEIVKTVFRVIKACVAASGVDKKRVEGVSFSCQMHSLMAVSKDGVPLTKLITWADTRAGEEAKLIGSRFDVGKLYGATGCRVQHPMYPLSKILWFKKHEPSVFERAYKFITIKEYLFFLLYGEYLADYTTAASQGYYNISRQDWDSDILQNILGLSKNRLSEVAECVHTVKGFRREYEEAIGLCRDTPFVLGSGDGIMANIGCGAFDESSMASTIGTSGAVRLTVGRPLLDPEQRTWCYSFTRDKWVAGGAISNGGIALKWLRDEFRQQFEADAGKYDTSLYKLFDRLAAEIPAGSEGLVFLPYLTGERSPDWNADARGILYGLSYTHGRRHMIRAAMEGVMYRLYSVYEVLSAMQDGVRRILVSGGYTKSEFWMQMQADIFGRDIYVTGIGEASALGAAYVAMCACGALRYGQSLPVMEPLRVIHPQEEAVEAYRDAYRRAMNIYGRLYGP